MKVERARRRIEKAHMAIELIPRSFVITLVAQYDAFLSDLIKNIFLARPELLSNSERKMTLSELNNFSEIEQARIFLISKEVENLLRKSHAEQFSWMERKFDIELTKGLDSWPVFIELTERRNLFVHCDGKVSEQYFAICRKHCVTLEDDAKLGAQLKVTHRYVIQSHRCLYQIGVKLCQVLWRKLFPDQLEEADENLIRITYELLVSEDYLLAKDLLYFATNALKKHASEVNNLILNINHAIAHKLSGDQRECKRILSSRDWSACEKRFKLAVAVLQENWDEASSIMIAMGKSEISEREYEEWPLFKEFRETKQFLEAFEKIFSKPFLEKVEKESA